MNYVVIWSAFCDAYIIKPLQNNLRLEIKASGTYEHCAAWIACQR